MAHRTEGTSTARAAQMVTRALVRRCPWCGGRGVFDGWFHTKPVCPHCGLRFDRGEGDFFYGAYMFNLIAAELIFVALLIVVVVATWPNTPWTALTWGSIVVAVVAPIFTYPIAKQVWLAFDLAFRPHRADRAP